MKRIFPILFFVLVLSTFSTKAQLAPIGTKWTFLTVDASGPQPNVYFYSSTGAIAIKDTIIDSAIYSLINGYYWTNQNNKIFYYYHLKKYLYFDFNTNKKDTLAIDLFIHNYDNGQDTIIQNYQIRIDDIYYHHYSSSDSILTYQLSGLNNLDSSLSQFKYWLHQTLSLKIIFGHYYYTINSAYAFSPSLFYRSLIEYNIEFQCYQEPGGKTIKADSSIDCSKVGIDEIKNYEKLISVFPNPSSGIFQIEIKNILKPKIVFIYDLKGDLVDQQILSSKKNAHSFSVQLNANQKDGLYYLLLELESGERVLKKIILQKTTN